MKKLILILTLALISMELFSQKSIQDNSTTANITINALDMVNNSVRYAITFNIFDIDSVLAHLPTKTISDVKIVGATNALITGISPIPNLYPVMDTATIVSNDVGLTGLELIGNFGVLLMYIDNPLQLDLSKWYIKED